MDYAKLIEKTLSPLSLPIKETIYTGTKPAYIVFTNYTEQAVASAANKPVEREYDFMINLYQKIEDKSVNLNSLEEQAINLLEAAGFNNVIARNRTDLETVNGVVQYNRWLIDCSYTENIES